MLRCGGSSSANPEGPPPAGGPGLFGCALAEVRQGSGSLVNRSRLPYHCHLHIERSRTHASSSRRLFTTSSKITCFLLHPWQQGKGRCDGQGPLFIRNWSPDAGATRVREPAHCHGLPGWSALRAQQPALAGARLWLSQSYWLPEIDPSPAVFFFYAPDLGKEIQDSSWNAGVNVCRSRVPGRHKQELSASADFRWKRPTQWLLSDHITSWLRPIRFVTIKEMVF